MCKPTRETAEQARCDSEEKMVSEDTGESEMVCDCDCDQNCDWRIKEAATTKFSA